VLKTGGTQITPVGSGLFLAFALTKEIIMQTQLQAQPLGQGFDALPESVKTSLKEQFLKVSNERELVAWVDKKFPKKPVKKSGKDGVIYIDVFCYSKIADHAVAEYNRRSR